MKQPRLQHLQKQRGVALIMAVLIVALATILAVNAASEGYMDQRRAGTMLALDEAYEIARGGEDMAADVLIRDARDSAKQDTLSEAWATPIELPVEDIGEIKGQLEDLQGRFNINNLIDPKDGSENKEAVQQLKRLLAILDIDPNLANNIVDWIDQDTVEHSPGAEDAAYSAQTPPYLTSNMPITRTSELLSVKGFTLEQYRKLEPYIAALPLGTSLNVCTAPGEVLDSLAAPSDRREYSVPGALKGRDGGCFPTMKDVGLRFDNEQGFKDLLAKHPNYLSETTNYFRADILVSIGTTELSLYSVLQRSGTGKVHVILRSFGTP